MKYFDKCCIVCGGSFTTRTKTTLSCSVKCTSVLNTEYIRKHIRHEDYYDIDLGNGRYAQIDIVDFERISERVWYAYNTTRKVVYAETTLSRIGKAVTKISMHRFILSYTGELLVDHIDRNGLNNRRANLRLATKAQNAYNQATKIHSSQHRGISWNKQTKKWRAFIVKDKKYIHLGNFTDEKLAAQAYDKAAKNLRGDFAILNNCDAFVSEIAEEIS